MTEKPQDRDPLRLGWRLGWRLVRRKGVEVDDHGWAIVFPDEDRLDLDVGSWQGRREINRLWLRALELKTERDQWHERCNAVTGEGATSPADSEAGAPETPGAPSPKNDLADVLEKAMAHGSGVSRVGYVEESTRAVALGQMERTFTHSLGPRGEEFPALTGEDIEQAVNEILRRHKELHDEGERLLKLAPETPPLVPDDPLSSEVVRAHDRCDDFYRGMRSFEARLANLEEVTAALDRRLDNLSLIRDKQQGSDD